MLKYSKYIKLEGFAIMFNKKLLSFILSASLAAAAFSGICLSAAAAEAVYNFSSLTESEYNIKSGTVPLFDGKLTLKSILTSGKENAKPLFESYTIAVPGGSAQITSGLKAKGEAVELTLSEGETVVVYYRGTDSAGTGIKDISMQVTNGAGTVVATESNEEKSGKKPYAISYKAASGGTYTISDTTTNRTVIYAVIVTSDSSFTLGASEGGAQTPTPNPNATPTPTPTPRPTVNPDADVDIQITKAVGWLETAYVEWTSTAAVDKYNVYVKPENGEYIKIDGELTRFYGDYYRADALGLKAGTYKMKIAPVIGGAEKNAVETGSITVKAQKREGFCFDSASSHYNPDGVGGYKNDGTVKDGAKIVYITNENKDTVKLPVVTDTDKGTVTEATGLSEILSCREKTRAETTPLIIRMIGQVYSPAGKNTSGYMQIKSTSNVTFEGVGDDAVAYQWSFLLRSTNNIEVRNLAVMEFYDDGISLDTDNFNDWVHNCDIFYGQDRGGDQKKGDGSLDVKSGSDYCTFSYNHFWDSGKSSLCGMKDDSYKGYHITYHHNWFDHSDSRHPRIRGDQVHIYNNFYDGNSKYGVGACTGSSAFVEANYFRHCPNPVLISLQGTDAKGAGTFSGETGGIIKMYNNFMTADCGNVIDAKTNATEFDAYIASTRSETVPDTYKTKTITTANGTEGGTVYSNFDTASTMYKYTPDNAEAVPSEVETFAGRMENGDFEYEFNDSEDDSDYSRNTVLGKRLEDYKTTLITAYTDGGYYPPTGDAPVVTNTPAPTATVTPSITPTATVTPTAAPTSAPASTTAPTAEKCVKITAVYDGDGKLISVVCEEADAKDAAPSLSGNTKIMYWESLGSMKPVK